MNKAEMENRDKLDFESNKLYVKYMVSLRCKIVVKSELENLGLPCRFTAHGALEFSEEIPENQLDLLKKNLLKSGLELLSVKESLLINKIIHTIVEVIHYTDSLPKLNYTDLIDKHAVSGGESILKIFSDVKGISILQFIIIQKIERAKELLLYGDLSLSEIAKVLNYKNEHYLAAQFKKITGLSPSYYKRFKKDRRLLAERFMNSAPPVASMMKSQHVS